MSTAYLPPDPRNLPEPDGEGWYDPQWDDDDPLGAAKAIVGTGCFMAFIIVALAVIASLASH